MFALQARRHCSCSFGKCLHAIQACLTWLFNMFQLDNGLKPSLHVDHTVHISFVQRLTPGSYGPQCFWTIAQAAYGQYRGSGDVTVIGF